jgi:hypothetical protein
MQPLLQWKSNKYYIFWKCFCSLQHPACKAHAPYYLYCHLWPVCLYNIFPHYLINGKIFKKKLIEHKMCVLIFSITMVQKNCLSKRNWTRYEHKCILLFRLSTHYSCQISMKFCSVGAKLIHTDRQTWWS